MADKDERIVELTRELMSKGMLIDQLSDQLFEMQGSLLSAPTPTSPTSGASSLLNHKQTLITNLSHSLVTTRRVLQLEKEGQGAIKSTLNAFMSDFSIDLQNIVGVVAQLTKAGEIDRSSAAKKYAALDKLKAAADDEISDLKRQLADLTASSTASIGSLTSSLAHLEDEHQAVRNSLDDSIEASGALQREVSMLTETLDEETSAHAETSRKLAKVQSALSKAEAAHSLLESQHSNLTTSHSTLTTTLAELQSSSDKRIGGLMNEVNEALSELRYARNSATTAAQKREEAMDLLQARLDAANGKIADLNLLLGSAKEGGKKESENLLNIQGQLDRAMKELGEKTSAHEKLSVSLAEAKSEIQQNKASMVKMNDAITESRNNEEDARAELRQVKSDVTTLQADFDTASRAVKERGERIDELEVNSLKQQVMNKSLEAEIIRLSTVLSEKQSEAHRERTRADTMGEDMKREKGEVVAKLEAEKAELIARLEAELKDARTHAQEKEDERKRTKKEWIEEKARERKEWEEDKARERKEWEEEKKGWEEERVKLAKRNDVMDGVMQANLDEKDELKREIENLQATVHKECLERAMLLDKMKTLQQQHKEQQKVIVEQEARQKEAALKEVAQKEVLRTESTQKEIQKQRTPSSAIIPAEEGEGDGHSDYQRGGGAASPPKQMLTPKPPPRTEDLMPSTPPQDDGEIDDAEKAWTTVTGSRGKGRGKGGSNRGRKKGGSLSSN